MIIYICDRCQQEKRAEEGQPNPLSPAHLCESCQSGYDDVKRHLEGYVAQVLAAYKRRDTQPEMKQIW